MLQPILTQFRPAYCYRHKKQIATHLCTQTKCNNNPILCSQCLIQGNNLTYHYDHEKSIIPISQGVQIFSQVIKLQSLPIQKIYKSTLGRGDFSTLVLQLEKGQPIIQQLENRITSIKTQIQLELELLVKDIQKLLLIQKQQYFKLLENYQKIFIKNLQFIKIHTQSLIQFQNTLKYYSNHNNFYLKMISQLTKKSDWLLKTKKTLQDNTKNIQNVNYINQINTILTTCNKIKFDIWPQWKNQDNNQKINQFKFYVKRIVNQWVYIPELKYLEDQIDGTMLGGPTMLKNYYVQSNGK